MHSIPQVPQGLIPRLWDVTPRPRFGDVKNLSTPETYKLAFYFKNANPEDMTVSLKGEFWKSERVLLFLFVFVIIIILLILLLVVVVLVKVVIGGIVVVGSFSTSKI